MGLESLNLLLDILSDPLNHFTFAFVFFALDGLLSIYSRRNFLFGSLLLADFKVQKPD
jgi:hypothetical protein